VDVVAEEERTRRERHETADLVLDECHRVRDTEAGSEGLGDFVERLLLTVCAGDVLNGGSFLFSPPTVGGRVGGGRRDEVQPCQQKIDQCGIE
jgi:hypothetical protein